MICSPLLNVMSRSIVNTVKRKSSSPPWDRIVFRNRLLSHVSQQSGAVLSTPFAPQRKDAPVTAPPSTKLADAKWASLQASSYRTLAASSSSKHSKRPHRSSKSSVPGSTSNQSWTSLGFTIPKKKTQSPHGSSHPDKRIFCFLFCIVYLFYGFIPHCQVVFHPQNMGSWEIKETKWGKWRKTSRKLHQNEVCEIEVFATWFSFSLVSKVA